MEETGDEMNEIGRDELLVDRSIRTHRQAEEERTAADGQVNAVHGNLTTSDLMQKISALESSVQSNHARTMQLMNKLSTKLDSIVSAQDLNFAELKQKLVRRVEFNDIIGNQIAVKEAQRIARALREPDNFTLPTSFLIVGPHGTGKAMIAKAIVWAVDNCDFVPCAALDDGQILVHSRRIVSLPSLFRCVTAKNTEPPIVLLIKDIHKVSEDLFRHLTAPDKMTSRILVIGSTNIDDAEAHNMVFDMSIFGKCVETNLPIFSERVQLVRKYALVKEIYLTENDEKELAHDTNSLSGLSLHEACHSAVSICSSSQLTYVSALPSLGRLGHVMALPDIEKKTVRKIDVLNEIDYLLAGYIGEELFLENKERVTTGCSNDLQRANKLAENYVTKWGFSRLGPIWVGTGSFVSPARMEEISNEITELMAQRTVKVKKFLKEHEEHVKAIAQRLYREERLTRSQLEAEMKRIDDEKKPTPNQ